MKTSACVVAALLLPSAALAENACQPFDTGQYPIGHRLSESERRQLSSQGPGASERGTLQCSRDGRSCSVLARDGTGYSWGEDGTIRTKSFIFYNRASLPHSLSGWKTDLDAALADRVSQATCARFRVETSDSGLTDNDLYLKSEGERTATGQGYVTTIFGEATQDDPLFVQMSLTP